VPFIWQSEQQIAFVAIKNIYKNQPFLCFFDPSLETELRTDASLRGLGGALMQKHNEQFLPVGYFSRLLIDSEKRYAIYDLEILAAVESVQYFNDLLLGHYFKLVVDNRAVSFIMNKKDLNASRLARHALYLSEYNFDIVYRPSSKNTLADFLSRYSEDHKLVDGKNITISEIEEFEKKSNSLNCLKTCAISTIKNNDHLKYLISQQLNDNELRRIIDILHKKINIDKTSKTYKYIIENFVIKDQVLCKFIESKNASQYLVCVPKSMRSDILKQYHDSNTGAHLGIKRVSNTLKERFYWRDMNKYIEQYIKSCLLCQMRKKPKTRASGLMQPIVTSNVFEMLAIDHLGPLVKSKNYEYIIVLTDYFSKFAICKPVAKNNAKAVAKFIFEDLICSYGRIPTRLLSDCSQAFIGKMVSHLNILLGIKQVKTSGYKPSTNSVTERFNGTLADCLSIYVNEK